MSRVIHFEIPANNTEKLVEFYKNTFGWEFTKWGEEDYWLCKTGNSDEQGIDGAIMAKRDPNQPIVNSISVASIDEIANVITANGGEIVVPKMAVGEMGFVAYFKDNEGNITGLWEMSKQP